MTEESPKNKPWAWIIALLIGGGILLLAWDRFGFGGDAPLAGGQGLVDQAIGASSPWTYGEEADPMTDELTVMASRQIEADGFLIDTTIACHPSTGTVTYTFTTFAEDGTAAEAVSQYYNQFLGSYHTTLVRVDRGQAQPIRTYSPRYSNQFLIEQTPETRGVSTILGNSTDVLADGQVLVVKLFLTQGEPVFEIDQADTVVANVLGICAQAASAAEDQKQTEAAAPREADTHTFTIVSDYRIYDSRNEVMSSLDRSGMGVERTAGLCVGDRLVITNDAAEPVELVGWIYESDDGSTIGTAAPGSSVSLDIREPGEFVIDSPQHETARLRYRVADCS